MGWIARDDAGALLWREMRRIVDRHGGDVTVRRALQQEPLHHRTHAHERRERQPHRPVADVRSGKTLKINVLGRFLIKPNVIEHFALKFLTSGLIRLQPDSGNAAAYVAHLHTIELVGDTTSCYSFGDRVLGD